MKDFDKWSFTDDAPPATLHPPLQALWWLKKGDWPWDRTRRGAPPSFARREEGEHAYDLVHALVHWIEGDKSNTAYWYRRVGRQRAADIKTEWQRIASELSKYTINTSFPPIPTILAKLIIIVLSIRARLSLSSLVGLRS